MCNRFCLRLFIVTTALLLAPRAMSAQPQAHSYYVTAVGGLVTQSSQTLDFAAAGAATRTKAPLDNGFLAGAAIGRNFGSNWRVEAEFMYQSVEHPRISLGTGNPSGKGNYASTSIALNALYDIDLLGSPRARTYIGAGAVYLTEVDIDFEANGQEQSYSGSDVAAQLLFGARYDLSPRTFLDVGVRYLLASKVKLDGEGGAPGRIRADYEPLAFSVGIGWRF